MRRLASCSALVVALAAGCLPFFEDDELPKDEPKLINAEEHEKYFPITEGAPHALEVEAFGGPLECKSCHKDFDNFKRFACIECHQEDAVSLLTVHREVAGFGIANPRCLTCHPDGLAGENLGIDEHNINDFPIDELSPHGNAAYIARVPEGQTTCVGCHASVADRSQLLCKECHATDVVPLTDSHNTLSQSFVNENVNCKLCHGTTPIPPAVVPATAHNDFFVVLPSHHTARTCADCHVEHEPEPKPWTIDWTANTCLPCHVAECSLANPGPCL